MQGHFELQVCDFYESGAGSTEHQSWAGDKPTTPGWVNAPNQWAHVQFATPAPNIRSLQYC